MEFDFYTAIDDLQPDDTAGASMMGTVQFNSACFYRYSNIDMEQLRHNLLGKEIKKATDEELSAAEGLARKALAAFLRASVWAIPTGKQNSMAAQNMPDAVFATVRNGGFPISLANAFATPIRSTKDKSLVQASVEAMDSYWGKLAKVYGENGVKIHPVCLVEGAKLEVLKDQQVSSFEELVKKISDAIMFEERK